MGRPSLSGKGPLTAYERQKRRRKYLLQCEALVEELAAIGDSNLVVLSSEQNAAMKPSKKRDKLMLDYVEKARALLVAKNKPDECDDIGVSQL